MSSKLPLVSCIMPTYNRRQFVPLAIRYFLQQEYPNKELIVVDDGTDSVVDLIPPHEQIRHVQLSERMVLGAKRNLACEQARGEIIVHWDDDDWSASDRVRSQVEALLAGQASICGLDRIFFYAPAQNRAWQFVYANRGRPWVYGASLCYRKSFWQTHRFPEIGVGEDTRFVWADARAKIHVLQDPSILVGIVHAANTSLKRTANPQYRTIPVEQLQQLLGSDFAFYSQPLIPAPTGPVARSASKPTALITAGTGIGDILRVTPLLQVFHELGYDVDCLLAADYPQVAELLQGAPQIRRVVCIPRAGGASAVTALNGTLDRGYDVVTLTPWTAPLRTALRGRRVVEVERAHWLSAGYEASVQQLARHIGWNGPLPPSFALASKRQFNLAPHTIAIHPGCNSSSPWKKWHGFGELARQFPHVVLVGSEEDACGDGTYFQRPIVWPEHAQNFIGRLNLMDTAALLRQCAALISNDSGLMHLAVALGIPTFGIFGITSPKREGTAAPNFHPISKGLPCEPLCRQGPWGRHDCAHHLQCLKTLTVEDVMNVLLEHAPQLTTVRRQNPAAARPSTPEAVTLGVLITGGIGDLIIGGALVRALAEKLSYSPADVFFSNPETARQVFHEARFIRATHNASAFGRLERRYDVSVRVLGGLVDVNVKNRSKLDDALPQNAEWLQVIASRISENRGLIDHHPSLDGLAARIAVMQGHNRVTAAGWMSNVPIDSNYFFALDHAQAGFVDSAIGTDEFLTIHDGYDTNHLSPTGTATKCWPIEHWAELVRQLHALFPKLKIVQLGARNSRPAPGVDVNLIGRTSLAQAAWVLKQSRLHIDGDSGLVHLAHATHTPCVVLFGPTNGRFFGYKRNANITSSECGDCWWQTREWLSRCPRGLGRPVCMTSISPSQVMAEAQRSLDSAPPSGGELVTASLYESVTLKTERPVLDQLFNQVGLPNVPISEHSSSRESGLYLHASKQWEYLFALRQIRESQPQESGLKIADVGGGRGALPAYLASLGHSVDVFDLNYLWDHGGEEGVERRYLLWARDRGYRADFGSAYNVPAEDATYDVVTSISVVEHLPAKTMALREAMRLLKPGGLLVLTFDFCAHPQQHQDGLRVEIFSPQLLNQTLARCRVRFDGFTPEIIAQSVQAIQLDGVRGIPKGLTVGGIAIRKAR